MQLVRENLDPELLHEEAHDLFESWWSSTHSQGQWNTTGHRDEVLDRLIEAQALQYDPLARKNLVQDIQRRALGSAYRFVPATSVSIWTWWPRVQDFHPNFAGSEYAHWASVWVEN